MKLLDIVRANIVTTATISDMGDVKIDQRFTETGQSFGIFLESEEFEQLIAKWIEQRSETVKGIGSIEREKAVHMTENQRKKP